VRADGQRVLERGEPDRLAIDADLAAE